jgi:hypothetical protein
MDSVKNTTLKKIESAYSIQREIQKKSKECLNKSAEDFLKEWNQLNIPIPAQQPKTRIHTWRRGLL